MKVEIYMSKAVKLPENNEGVYSVSFCSWERLKPVLATTICDLDENEIIKAIEIVEGGINIIIDTV